MGEIIIAGVYHLLFLVFSLLTAAIIIATARALFFGLKEWTRAFNQVLDFREVALSFHEDESFSRIGQLFAIMRMTWMEFGDVYHSKTIQDPNDPTKSTTIPYNGNLPE